MLPSPLSWRFCFGPPESPKVRKSLSVGSFSDNVGLSALIFSLNLGTKLRCSRAERFTLSGRYR